MAYDRNNTFAKILLGTLPKRTVCENEHAIAFYDVNPKSPIHVVLIPKGAYTSAHEFYSIASKEEILGFSAMIAKVISLLDIESSGYRLISNQGLNGGQEVPHFHVHVLAGKDLGPFLVSST